MKEKEQCGDYEVFLENDWWVVRNTKENRIIGKFITKEDALEKIANFLRSVEGREESESVC